MLHTGDVNVALKEWSAVVEACGQGKQIFLLRKGGIVEAARRGFEVRYPRFFFFPAFEHQHLASLKPQYHELATPQTEGVIRIGHLAQVAQVLPAPAARTAWDFLDGFHVWQPSLLDMRYNYRPDLPLHLIVIRTFKLPKQLEIPDRPSYAGCKSWVHLTEELSMEGAEPVLDDKSFNDRKGSLLSALEAATTMR